MKKSLPFAAVMLAASATFARAQQSVADVLTFIVTNQTVSTGNLERDRAAAQATSDTISRAARSRSRLPVKPSGS